MISSRTEARATVLLAVSVIMCCGMEIRVPVNYTALTGDLEIHVQNLKWREQYYLQLLEYYYPDGSYTIISSTPLKRNNVGNVVYKAIFPCGLISQGGQFGVRVQSHDDNNPSFNNVLVGDIDKGIENDIVRLDVRWPLVSLSIEPEEIETYSDQNVTASVAFPKSYCDPSIGSLVPEMWISLIYCGHSLEDCKLDNISHMSQILYSEQIRGYPSLKYISLNCNLFGQAGYYTLFLTSGMHGTGAIISTIPSSRILKAKWSERFVFNVHTRSIFQCDAHGGGVAVLFQYPECILSSDKIRLFGSLRADVASSVPPTSLHYVTEHKVVRGKYSVHFDCDLFSEKYVEYCFVYVNQAITGAVSDVRMDCVPTFPISDKDAGQWGGWSEWSECSTTCVGGTRSRYRFCDSPSPKYGAKYCQGHTVETQPCGNSLSWECHPFDVQISPELVTEKHLARELVGEKCRCGCVIHLDVTMPQRFLAASTRNCSRKVWWKIQADPEHTIQLHTNRVQLPCRTQKLKIHDGEFLSSNLLAQFTSTDFVSYNNFSVVSSGSFVLLEYSISENSNDTDCAGGFLCHFRQKAVVFPNISHVRAEGMSGEMPVEAAHLVILVILAVAVTMSLCMTAQYVNRYNKYQKASVNDEFTDTECSETYSKQDFAAVISHETSISTLISEIIPLRKIGDPKERMKSDYSEHEFCSLHSEIEESDHAEQASCLRGEEQSEIGLFVCQKESVSISSKIVEDVHKDDRTEKTPGDRKSTSSYDEERGSVAVNSHSSKMDECERRPSTCTRTSASSSISPISSSLTNVAPSPNSSVGGSTLKRVKDIRNKEKAAVGSDFSLSGQEVDLEMDYYDYNVYNTNAVPGSYLGMDPAYCVWIPPFAANEWADKDKDKGCGCGDRVDRDDVEVENSRSVFQLEPDSIEMRVLSRRRSGPSPVCEKFQKECRNRVKEKLKGDSSVSAASGSNWTVVPDDGDVASDNEDDLTIQAALLPDSPVRVRKALVVTEPTPRQSFATSISSFLAQDDLKFADDDDSDTAYNSEGNGGGGGDDDDDDDVDETAPEESDSPKKMLALSRARNRPSSNLKLACEDERNCRQ